MRFQAVWGRVRGPSGIQTAARRLGAHTGDVSRKRHVRFSCRPGPEPPGVTQAGRARPCPWGRRPDVRVRVALPPGDTHAHAGVTISHGLLLGQSNTGHEKRGRLLLGHLEGPVFTPRFQSPAAPGWGTRGARHPSVPRAPETVPRPARRGRGLNCPQPGGLRPGRQGPREKPEGDVPGVHEPCRVPRPPSRQASGWAPLCPSPVSPGAPCPVPTQRWSPCPVLSPRLHTKRPETHAGGENTGTCPKPRVFWTWLRPVVGTEPSTPPPPLGTEQGPEATHVTTCRLVRLSLSIWFAQSSGTRSAVSLGPASQRGHGGESQPWAKDVHRHRGDTVLSVQSV